jgi:hypothetical protein
MWYQAVRCGDGYLEQEYLFGYKVFKTDSIIKLSLKETRKTYPNTHQGILHPKTWNYELNHCNFIFKGE